MVRRERLRMAVEGILELGWLSLLYKIGRKERRRRGESNANNPAVAAN